MLHEAVNTINSYDKQRITIRDTIGRVFFSGSARARARAARVTFSPNQLENHECAELCAYLRARRDTREDGTSFLPGNAERILERIPSTFDTSSTLPINSSRQSRRRETTACSLKRRTSPRAYVSEITPGRIVITTECNPY